MRRESCRYLVVHLPAFRLERAGWGDAERVALIGEIKNAPRVLSASLAARREGVRVGMTLAEARAMLPDLEVELLDLSAERADLQELARQLQRVSPAVLAFPPDILAAELAGGQDGRQSAAMVRERALMGDLAAHLRGLGHRVVLVVADDFFGARMLAIWGGRTRLVAPGALPAALAPLPITALGAAEHQQRVLDALGLRTVGELARLPPAAVVGRFGAWGQEVHRVIRGERPAPGFTAGGEDGTLRCAQELPCPLDNIEPLLFVLNRLIRELAATLQAMGRGVTRLFIALELDAGGEASFSFRTGRPLRDPVALSRLVRHRLEGVALQAEVHRVRLEAPDHAPFSGQQAGLTERPDSGESLPELVARLADALGDGAVSVPRLLDVWRPEGAWVAVSAAEVGLADGPASDPGVPAPLQEADDDPAWVHEAWRLSIPNPRPALLLEEPRRVELEPAPAHGVRPRRVRFDARWLQVLACRGPEHLDTAWWDDPFTRIYWILLLEDGRLAWVRVEAGHAWVHGWFDQGMGMIVSSEASSEASSGPSVQALMGVPL